MDPISISAAVVTFVDAGGQLAKLIKKGIDLKDAPQVLRALDNEISRLRIIVGEVDDLLRTPAEDGLRHPPRALVSELENLKSILLQLEEYMAYELTIPTANGSKIRIDKSEYIRAERRLQEYKHQIYEGRSALGTALSLFASSIALQSQLQSRRFTQSVALLVQNYEAGQGPRAEPLNTAYLSQQIDHPCASKRASFALPMVCEETPFTQSLNDNTGEETAFWGLESPQRQSPIRTLSTENKIFNERSVHAPTSYLFQHDSSTECPCVLLSYRRVRSSTLFSFILGSLCIRYRVGPALERSCSHVHSQHSANSISFDYVFPSWLIGRTLSILYSSSLAKGPELLIRVMRRRDFTRILHCISDSKDSSQRTDRMKRMLDIGQASVFDVDKHGWTIIHWAVLINDGLTVRLLLSYGADMHRLNTDVRSTNSPFITACLSRWLHFQDLGFNNDEWTAFFCQSSAQSEFFRFPDLHRAYFRIGGLTMDQYLTAQKSIDVNVVDRCGMTVLLWAVIRGDSDAVRSLLRRGADPNQKDRKGRTPLTSSRGENLTIVNLLLEAGADINNRNQYGRSLPLMAVRGRHYSVLKRCLSNPDLDPDARSTYGEDIFILAALEGDTHTLEILRDQWRAGVNLEYQFEGKSAIQWAKFRRCYDPEHWMAWHTVELKEPHPWYKAFVDMIRTIRKRHSMVCSQAVYMENNFAVDETENSEDDTYEDAIDQTEEDPC